MTDPAVALPRILFVTPASPFEVASGSQQRSALFLAALRGIGSVDVVQIEVAEETSEPEMVEQAGQRMLRLARRAGKTAGRYAWDEQVIGEIRNRFGLAPCDYDLIVGRYVWPCCQVATGRGAPLLVDLDDLRYRYSAGSARSFTALKERVSKWAAWQLVRRQLGRFKAAFVLSPLDQAEHGLLAHSTILPNVPWAPPVAPQAGTQPRGKRLLFVGSLWYRPNAEGVDWFVERVWPQVLQAEPDAELLLIGAASPAVRQRWSSQPRVQAPGFVDDLTAAYAQSALVIAPIHSGGGSNIKLIEGLAHARACVTTRFTYRAVSHCLEENRDVLVAEAAPAFARHCIALLRDPQRRQALGQAGLDASRQHFTRERFERTVAETARALLADPERTR